MALQLSRQQALDAERERVVVMQRRQQEQEQFSAFEEMIRRQELEKERQRVLLDFATPVPPSPDTPLLPGIQGPPMVSPSAPQSPRDLSSGANNQYGRPPATASPPATAPPSFDRSLKPGSLVSPGNNSELIYHKGPARRGFIDCPTLLSSICSSELISFPPDLLHFLFTPCLLTEHHKSIAFPYSLFSSCYDIFADTMVDALRQLVIPSELCRSFLRLAEANTSRAVETCGILCGKLVRLGKGVTVMEVDLDR